MKFTACIALVAVHAGLLEAGTIDLPLNQITGGHVIGGYDYGHLAAGEISINTISFYAFAPMGSGLHFLYPTCSVYPTSCGGPFTTSGAATTTISDYVTGSILLGHPVGSSRSYVGTFSFNLTFFGPGADVTGTVSWTTPEGVIVNMPVAANTTGTASWTVESVGIPGHLEINSIFNLSFQATPEPSTASLVGLALLLFLARRWAIL